LIKILIVEDHAVYGQTLHSLLSSGNAVDFEPTRADSLGTALGHLEHEAFDVILLDLSLPDSAGLRTFSEIYAKAPLIPIVVLTALDSRALALEILRGGAQDYLVKEDADFCLLERTLLYAIERNRLRITLEDQSLKDDLTGLLNRRGFLTMAQQQIKIAQRENLELILLFADLDGLKHINDTFGHPEGDRALRAVANILEETFRGSDIVARLGGDEFIVLAINARASSTRALEMRLAENIARRNAQSPLYPLSLSFGVAQSDPHDLTSLEELIAQADAALYEQKRSKRKA
jgi:diguanylate cyclase (GGDEF)-like protein